MATEYRPAPNAEVGGRNIDPENHRNICLMTDEHRFYTLGIKQSYIIYKLIICNCNINRIYLLFLQTLIQFHPPIAIRIGINCICIAKCSFQSISNCVICSTTETVFIRKVCVIQTKRRSKDHSETNSQWPTHIQELLTWGTHGHSRQTSHNACCVPCSPHHQRTSQES